MNFRSKLGLLQSGIVIDAKISATVKQKKDYRQNANGKGPSKVLGVEFIEQNGLAR